MRRRFHPRLALGLLAAALPVVPASAQDAPTVAYEGARIWTGEGFEPATLYVRGGVFVDATTRPDSTVNVGGGWIVPPFGDAHSHTLGFGPYALRLQQAFLDDGVFYAMDLTNPASGAAEVRDAFARPGTVDVAFAMGGVSADRGDRPHPATTMQAIYGDDDAEGWTLEGDAFWHFESAEEAEARVGDLLAQGPDVVKVYVMAADPEAGDCGYGLCPDALDAVVARARAAGKRVFAHVNTAADVRVALEAGVDALAHLPLGNDGIAAAEAGPYLLDDATVAEIGARRLAITPTSHLLVREAETFPVDSLPEELALQAEQLRAVHRAGGRLALSGHDWQVTSAREARYLVEHGIFPPATVLKLWAETTPAAIFPDRRIGRLAPGYEASFLVLDGDPTDDFDYTRRIRFGVKQGGVVTGEAGG